MSAEDNIDQIVRQNFFKTKTDGVIIDVGAAGPEYLSISAHFRSIGWRVIAIEPNPAFVDLYKAQGIEVLQYACGDHDDDNVEFFVVTSSRVNYLGGVVTHESISSLGIKEEFVQLLDTLGDRASVTPIKVKLRKLDAILSTHAPDIGHVDVLAVDVEGWEMAVIRGFSIEKYSPSVVILENQFKKPEYTEEMKVAGYALWASLGLNEIYVKSRLLTPTIRLKGAVVTAETRLRKRAKAAISKARSLLGRLGRRKGAGLVGLNDKA